MAIPFVDFHQTATRETVRDSPWLNAGGKKIRSVLSPRSLQHLKCVSTKLQVRQTHNTNQSTGQLNSVFPKRMGHWPGIWWAACLAQVGIDNADLTISRLSWTFPFPGETFNTTTHLRQILCKDSTRVQLLGYRVSLHRSFQMEPQRIVPSSIIDGKSPIYPLPICSVGCLPLPTC